MIAQASVVGSLAWVEVALLIFVAVFLIVVAGVIFRRRGHFDDAASIPLRDDADPVSTPEAGS